MTPAQQTCLRSYTLCIRKMIEALRGIGVPAPSEVILWVQSLEEKVRSYPNA